jgi:dihydrofolate reductase
MPVYNLIACVDSKNGIGLNNSIPWYEPEDLKIFKDLTNGETVIMGKNTYNSILTKLKKPLPNRKNIVLTTGSLMPKHGLATVKSFEDCLEKYNNAWIIGGANVYRQFLPLCQKLYISRLRKDYNCDTFFPKIPDNFYLSYKETYSTFDLLVFKTKIITPENTEIT